MAKGYGFRFEYGGLGVDGRRLELWFRVVVDEKGSWSGLNYSGSVCLYTAYGKRQRERRRDLLSLPVKVG